MGASDAISLRACHLELASDVRLEIPDFDVAQGERLAVTGPSGCGKSTLLHLLSGLLVPDAGTVEVHGENLAGLSARARDRFRGRHVGFVYQTFNLLPHFNPRENVMIGLRFGRKLPKRERLARADAVLETVGLSHRASQRVGDLSIGEQQRVAIARALANRPSLLLADEPTGSLDPDNGRRVFELLNQVVGEASGQDGGGCTLVLVTHDLELARELPRQFDARDLITNREEAQS